MAAMWVGMAVVEGKIAEMWVGRICRMVDTGWRVLGCYLRAGTEDIVILEESAVAPRSVCWSG
jgi:hypothetical protein